jgi:hypothetical protein
MQEHQCLVEDRVDGRESPGSEEHFFCDQVGVARTKRMDDAATLKRVCSDLASPGDRLRLVRCDPVQYTARGVQIVIKDHRPVPIREFHSRAGTRQ